MAATPTATREVVALVSSRKDGPPTRVERVCAVRVDGGDFSDVVELEHLTQPGLSFQIRGNTMNHIDQPWPPGVVRVVRKEGENPVSIYLSTF